MRKIDLYQGDPDRIASSLWIARFTFYILPTAVFKLIQQSIKHDSHIWRWFEQNFCWQFCHGHFARLVHKLFCHLLLDFVQHIAFIDLDYKGMAVFAHHSTHRIDKRQQARARLIWRGSQQNLQAGIAHELQAALAVRAVSILPKASSKSANRIVSDGRGWFSR